jgi:hypothetical protein
LRRFSGGFGRRATVQRIALLFFILTYTSCVSACDSSARDGSDRVRVIYQGMRTVLEVTDGLSVACEVNGAFGPRSYLIADIGRPGVPRLTTEQRALAKRIRRYVHSRSLRFTFFGEYFAVFDAVQGPCYTQAPGYQVLNAPRCNSYYSPTDNFDGPRATTGCPNSPRPWMNSPNQH